MQTATPQVLQITKAGLRYNPQPSAKNNQRTWQLIQTTLAAGPTTAAQLTDVVSKAHNHGCMVKYAIRSGWLALVNATAPAATTAATKPKVKVK